MSSFRTENAPSGAARAPVILNHLGPVVAARLAGHWSRPTVIERDESVPAWTIPSGVDVLLTRPLIGWDKAPSTPPAGWPGDLRWIQTASTGVDFYPRWLLAGGPPVTCGRGVSAGPIAEFVLAAVLAHEKRFDAIRLRGPDDWRREVLGSLSGKRLGLVGYGAIGRAVAARAAVFGAVVGAVRRSPWPVSWPVQGTEPAVEPFDDLRGLVAVSDHLVLAAPLTPGARPLIDAGVLSCARPGLHLINVARGGLVDQDALLAALNAGRVAAATLDVTEPEPLPAGHPFYSCPAVRLPPHLSWSDPATESRLADKVIANLDAYVRREPLRDVVDAIAGY